MADPNRDLGMQYLYETQHRSPAKQQTTDRQHQQQEPTLVMAPLPHSNDGSRDWGPAHGNLQTAKLALETLRGLIMDAVFLDEDAYTNAATLQLYQQRLQVGSCKCKSTQH